MRGRLYYFGARYYDPQTSRFMSADPLKDGVEIGLSLYSYCMNNPVNYTDPTGLATWDPNKGGYNNDVIDQSGGKLGFQGNIQSNPGNKNGNNKNRSSKNGSSTNNGGGSNNTQQTQPQQDQTDNIEKILDVSGKIIDKGSSTTILIGNMVGARGAWYNSLKMSSTKELPLCYQNQAEFLKEALLNSNTRWLTNTAGKFAKIKGWIVKGGKYLGWISIGIALADAGYQTSQHGWKRGLLRLGRNLLIIGFSYAGGWAGKALVGLAFTGAGAGAGGATANAPGAIGGAGYGAMIGQGIGEFAGSIAGGMIGEAIFTTVENNIIEGNGW